MKNVRTFIFLIVWLFLASVVSLLSSLPTISLAIASSFLAIAVLVIMKQLWKGSTSFGLILKKNPRNPERGMHDNLSRAALYVRYATRGSPYGRREVAEILREALLSKYLGRSTFPTSWIATSSGDHAIESILRSKNSVELTGVFELPEIASPRGPPNDKEEYFSRLDKALTLIEERN